jgi:hypothetical protein
MDNLDKIKNLLEKRGIKKNTISLDTTIQSLGFGPDEIDDFFNDYSKEFKVDSNNYNYYDYFFEMVHPIYILKDNFNRVLFPSKVKKLPITIEHLLKVADRGEWFKPG